MRRLFLFNPENDIALGSGLPRITPPRQAGLLHRAGAMLPFWLGEEGDSVIVAPEDLTAATAWRKEIAEITGVTGPWPVAECSPGEELTPSPWGWSRDAAWQFMKAAGCGDVFEGEIVEVASNGPITLKLRSGKLRVFNFKEVVAVI